MLSAFDNYRVLQNHLKRFEPLVKSLTEEPVDSGYQVTLAHLDPPPFSPSLSKYTPPHPCPTVS